MRCWMVLLLLVVMPAAAQEKSEQAAVLAVRVAPVEVLRVDTEAWIAVSAGAVMPIGSGDRVRTGVNGRADISFDRAGRMLLLPESELFIKRYEQERVAEGVVTRFHGALDGVLVQRWEDAPLDYALMLEDAATLLVAPGRHSAVWALPGVPDVVASASGAAVTQAALKRVDVAEGQIAWLDDPASVVALGGALNNARLEGDLFGCPATVRAQGADSLLVRRGIGTGNERLGLLPNGEVIRIMAQNESASWVRIQFRNHFGWVLRSALALDCADLARLPDTTPPERLYSVVDATADEAALLRPFYGDPAADPFFYRTTPR